ncbi:MAG: phasin [Pseudomonadota bacterium]
MTTPKPKAAPKTAAAKTAAPKAAAKPAPKAEAKVAETDVFAFPPMPAMPAMEVPPAFRDFAETSVQRSKEAYEKFKVSAEDATSVLEETIAKTRDGVIEFNSKALELAQENTDATFAHVKDVFAVKSFSEAIELQTSFMKKQVEALQDQAKTFQDMTARITKETSAPYKEAFQKTAETFKVA